jgi:hypothetical protein
LIKFENCETIFIEGFSDREDSQHSKIDAKHVLSKIEEQLPELKNERTHQIMQVFQTQEDDESGNTASLIIYDLEENLE